MTLTEIYASRLIHLLVSQSPLLTEAMAKLYLPEITKLFSEFMEDIVATFPVPKPEEHVVIHRTCPRCKAEDVEQTPPKITADFGYTVPGMTWWLENTTPLPGPPPVSNSWFVCREPACKDYGRDIGFAHRHRK